MYSQLSIVNSFGGILEFKKLNIYSINLNQTGLSIFSSNFTIKEFTATNITKNVSSPMSRFIRIEESSIGTISNSKIANISLVFLSSVSSQMEISNWIFSNMTWRRNTLEFITSTGVILRNVSTYNLTSTQRPNMFQFSNSVIEEISNCSFTLTQPIAFVFQSTLLKKFDHNLLNLLNKGIRLTSGSIGYITNTKIMNMVQNFTSGSLYQSNINSDGSAIGKNLKLYIYRNNWLECDSW